MRFFYKASILCMLACGSSYTMDSPNLGSFLNVRSVGMRLAELTFGDNKITFKDISGLYTYVHIEKVLGLFFEDPTVVENYLDKDTLTEYLGQLQKEDDSRRHRLLKAITLQNIIKIPAWEEALECIHLERALESFTNLYYFSGSQEEKKALIRRLKQDITNLRPAHAGDRKLVYETVVDIPALQTLLDDLLEDKEVTTEQMLSTFSFERLNLSAGITKTFHVESLVRFMIAVLFAESPAQAPLAFLTCLRWDVVIDDIPKLLGCTEQEFEKVVHVPNLKAALTAFQQGKPLTPELLRAVFYQDAFKVLGFGFEVDEVVDFVKLADALTKLRQCRLDTNLKNAFNLKTLSKILGIDVETAFDASQPLEVQKHALEKLFDQFTYDGCLTSITENGRNVLAALPLVWLTYHYPHQAGALCAAAAGLYYYTKKNLPSKRSMVLITNSLVAHGSRLVSQVIDNRTPSERRLTNLLALAPDHPRKDDVEQFLRLCQEHLERLNKPAMIFSIFDSNEIFVFLSTNEEFIDHICSDNEDQAYDRILMLREELEKAYKPKQLPQHRTFNMFTYHISQQQNCDDMVHALPHSEYFLLAEYRPQLLMRQHDFLGMLTHITTGAEQTPLLQYLLAACKAARQLET